MFIIWNDLEPYILFRMKNEFNVCKDYTNFVKEIIANAIVICDNWVEHWYTLVHFIFKCVYQGLSKYGKHYNIMLSEKAAHPCLLSLKLKEHEI
jgi:hypothetical protein